jgi:hypothetical protein
MIVAPWEATQTLGEEVFDIGKGRRSLVRLARQISREKGMSTYGASEWSLLWTLIA